MFPRNSSLSLSNLYETTTRFVSKHSRASVVASVTVAASALGVIGATVASASTTPATISPAPQYGATHTQFSALFDLTSLAPGQQSAAALQPAQAQPAAVHRPVAKLVAGLGVAQHPAAKPRPVAKPAAARPQAPVGPTKPYTIYDSVTPSSIPSGQRVAVYANGSYFAPASAVAGRSHVLWIDTNGSDPQANVLDVEPGDATPYGAAQWAQARLGAHPHEVAIIYTMLSQWQAVKDNVAALPGWMQAKVRYWIADPTGYNHVVPGSNATQWYWGQNYDITTANPGFEH